MYYFLASVIALWFDFGETSHLKFVQCGRTVTPICSSGVDMRFHLPKEKSLFSWPEWLDGVAGLNPAGMRWAWTHQRTPHGIIESSQHDRVSWTVQRNQVPRALLKLQPHAFLKTNFTWKIQFRWVCELSPFEKAVWFNDSKHGSPTP